MGVTRIMDSEFRYEPALNDPYWEHLQEAMAEEMDKQKDNFVIFIPDHFLESDEDKESK